MKYQFEKSSPVHLLLPQNVTSGYQHRVTEREFEIISLDLMQEDPIKYDVPKPLHNAGIIWVKKGPVPVSIDLDQFILQDNELICHSPGQSLDMQMVDKGEGYYISFTEDFLLMAQGQANDCFMDFLYQGKNTAFIHTLPEVLPEMVAVVGMMVKEYNQYGITRLQILQGLLKILVAYISGNMNLNEQVMLHDREAEIVRRFMKLVKKYFLTKKMVSDYASELCVSANYLNRVVKKISGFTASHHIQQQIILEAKRQAMFSTMSMKEVAYSLGFNDYAHFSKFFKNNSGMNFTCYKNNINKRA